MYETDSCPFVSMGEDALMVYHTSHKNVRGEGALPPAGVNAAAGVRVVERVHVVVGREDAREDLR